MNWPALDQETETPKGEARGEAIAGTRRSGGRTRLLVDELTTAAESTSARLFAKIGSHEGPAGGGPGSGTAL